MMPGVSPHSYPATTSSAEKLERAAFLRALLLLIGVACVGALLVGVVVAQLTPVDTPTDGGRMPATRGIPSLTRVPSHVETNGAPLAVTVHASTADETLDHRITRYLVTVQPPNATPTTLCDGPTEMDCALSLTGSPAQRGIWIFTLTTTDENGASAETRERMRVT